MNLNLKKIEEGLRKYTEANCIKPNTIKINPQDFKQLNENYSIYFNNNESNLSFLFCLKIIVTKKIDIGKVEIYKDPLNL